MLSLPTPTCAEVRRELEAVALGQASAIEAAAVRRHIRRCPQCWTAAGEIAALVKGLRALGAPQRRRPRIRAAAAVLAVAGLLFALETWTPRGQAESAGPADGVARLVLAQCADGAWREAGEPSLVLTVGLSGLATVSCLGAGEDDEKAAGAGRLGCDYLARTVQHAGFRETDAPPDLRIRAQAAAAWALGLAAERWPARYRRAAAPAVRDLRALEEAWSRPGGGLVLDEMTALLVGSARSQAASLGIQRAPEVHPGRRSAPTLLATRLRADRPGAADGTLTRLASQTLAEAIPRVSGTTF